MSRPQVLVFISWYAPGFKAGGPVRSMVNMVDHLHDRVDFHIVTSDTDYTATGPYPDITPDQWTVLSGGERVWYASRAKAGASAWRKLLAERAWDAVYINGLYDRTYSVLPLWLLRGSTQRRVLAVRGMLAAGMMQHGTLKKRTFLAVMRLVGCYRGVEFQATNAEEVRDVASWLRPDRPAHLVPNLPRKAPAAQVRRSKEAGVLRLLSVARIAVEKNTLFAIERLKGLQGDIRFDLYGPIYDERYWQQCRTAIAALAPNIQVVHKGSVAPDQVPELFARYHALFMPSQGENFGHTMAEALQAGLPLVISDRTPWRGLESLDAGWDLPLERTGDFSRALERLVHADQATYDRWSAGALRAADRYLDTPRNVERTFALFRP